VLSASVGEKRIGRAFSMHAFFGYLGYAAAPLVMAGLGGMAGWRTAVVAVGVVGLVYMLAMMTQSGDFRESATAGAARRGGGSGIEAGKTPAILFCFLLFIVLAMGQIGFQTFGAAAIIDHFGKSLEAANGIMGAYLIATTIGILIGGVVVDRTTRYDLAAALAVTGTAALFLLSALVEMPDLALGATLVVAGLIFGTMFPCRDMIVRAATPAGASGRVYGFVYSGLDIGSALTPVTFGLLLDRGLSGWVMITVAALFASGTLVALAAAWAAGTNRRAAP
jgi:MFS transporter, FSR family, fosmidomycin resistance protein